MCCVKRKEDEAKEKLEKEIKKAEQKQDEIKENKKKQYIKCVCSKCGEVFYIEFDKCYLVEM